MLREVERRRLDWELGGCPTSAIWDEEEQEAIRAEQAARWEAMLASCREAEEEAREAARSGLSIDDQTSNSSSPSPADPPTETPCKTGGTEPPHPERHQHALFVDLYKRIIVKVNKSTFDSYDGVTKTALGDYIAGRIAGRVSEPKARAIEAAICAEAIRLKMHIPQDLRTRFDA
ncbi:hypothetical protein F183_A29800 [Bryobacterales bacterium F-183]|nr:hypothetical protein F183_A29800 [Bryobacterales bacterium F-183]